jgi:hypothetical protein
MDYEAIVKMKSSGSAGAVLVSAAGQATLHHFDLWFTEYAETIGFGVEDPTTHVTTWTIYLSSTSSTNVKKFSPKQKFKFVWGHSLDLVDTANPVGSTLP